jgi:hypothetical protein
MIDVRVSQDNVRHGTRLNPQVAQSALEPVRGWTEGKRHSIDRARRHDLDVELYLKDVLDQLLAGSTDYHGLLPDAWKQHFPVQRIGRRVGARDAAKRNTDERLDQGGGAGKASRPFDGIIARGNG